MSKNIIKSITSIFCVFCIMLVALPVSGDAFIIYNAAESFAETEISQNLYAVSNSESNLLNTKAPEFSRDSVILGGELIGVRIKTKGAVVSSVSRVETKNGYCSPAEKAGIRSGDIINEINGIEIDSISDFSKVVSKSGAEPIKLKINRNSDFIEKTVSPVIDINGDPKVGMYLKDKAAGIGTVTFRNENGGFAALGHGICESQSGVIYPVNEGSVFETSFIGIEKSSNGKAGEIKGSLLPKAIGSLCDNTVTGIYGTSDFKSGNNEKIEIISKDQIKKGKIQIISTVDESGKKAYDAEIEEILNGDSKTKNFIIKITDPELLAKTGGIVQGMSGSPIVQNGKLIGAVTHVFLGDSSKGYGIFAENMLNTAQSVANENKLRDVS